MDIEFTVKLLAKNAIDPESLAEYYHNDPLEYIKFLTQEEGLLGCVEDCHVITEAHEITESEQVLWRRRAVMDDYDAKL